MSHSMPLSQLLPDVASVPPDLRVGGLVQDSRQLGPGDAFFALEGLGTHGLKFAAAAKAAGAAAILFEPPAPTGVDVPAGAIAVPRLRARMGAIGDTFHGAPSAAMAVVGVTGTSGKTSTVQLLAQAWHSLGQRAGTLGTLGVGLDGRIESTGFTTPQVLQVHALLAQLRDAGAQAVAMEVSSHALDQGRVDGVRFRVGVFTNLSRDHLDYHGDMRRYAAAKARLLAWPGLSAAVVNLDDAHGRILYAGLSGAVTRIGVSSRGDADARVRAEAVKFDGDGVGFDLLIDRAAHPVRSPLLGRFNVDNLLAVAAVLHALDVPAGTIAGLLPKLQPIAGRMTRLGGAGGEPLVVVDYSHKPDPLQQALDSLRVHTSGALVCVFGCGGERDRGKRPQMAAIAETAADRVVVTDDNPRGEDGDAIVADILAGFRDPDRVVVERDRAAAIARAVGEAGAGDIVLIAGKGHETYQEVDGERRPFDDVAVATAALEARR